MNGTGWGDSTEKRTARQWHDPLSSMAAPRERWRAPYHLAEDAFGRDAGMAQKQLTLAKLSPPRLHDVLPRTRLFDDLDDALQRPVAWLAAQPGAGKTTLVATYLQARKREGIWYQVDDGDADAASFIYHVRLAAGEPGRALPL